MRRSISGGRPAGVLAMAPLLVLALLAPAAGIAQAQEIAAADPSAITINFWNPAEVVRRGGYLIWPILFCSVVTITAGLERLVRLRRARVIPRRFVKRFLQRLRDREIDQPAAMEMCRDNPAPIAGIFRAAIRHWGKPTAEIEAAIDEAGQRQIARLTRNLRTLQGAGNLATLLGLLGTVLGMIQAFNQVAVFKGSARAEVLATGIAQALLTTAAGLAVAIPSLFLYHFFAGRVERLVGEMDELAQNVLDEISAEARTPHAGRVPPRPVREETAAPRLVADPVGE